MSIKFLVKLGKSGNENREMLVQVYGDNAMKKTAVYKRAKRFSEGRESVTEEERLGRPPTCRTEENKENCFEGCTRRWHRCIASQGEHFEGEHGGIQQ